MIAPRVILLQFRVRDEAEATARANWQTAWQLSLDLNQPSAVRENYRRVCREASRDFQNLVLRPGYPLPD